MKTVLSFILSAALVLAPVAMVSAQTAQLESLNYNAAAQTISAQHRVGMALLTLTGNANAKSARVDASDGVQTGFIQVQIDAGGPNTLLIDVGLGTKTASAMLVFTFNSPPAVGFDPGLTDPDFMTTLQGFAKSNLGSAISQLASEAEAESSNLTGAANRECPGTGNLSKNPKDTNSRKSALIEAYECMGQNPQFWHIIKAGAALIAISACLGQVAGCAIGPGDYSDCIVDDGGKC
jgi:hypothetical protein